MRLVVSREAAADLERLRAFLTDKNRAAAERAVLTLTRAIQSLGNLPDRGRPCGALGIRELIVPFGNSAYIVRYAHRADAGEIVVLRVWHGRELRN